jgi:hypothetical protein
MSQSKQTDKLNKLARWPAAPLSWWQESGQHATSTLLWMMSCWRACYPCRGDDQHMCVAHTCPQTEEARGYSSSSPLALPHSLMHVSDRSIFVAVARWFARTCRIARRPPPAGTLSVSVPPIRHTDLSPPQKSCPAAPSSVPSSSIMHRARPTDPGPSYSRPGVHTLRVCRLTSRRSEIMWLLKRFDLFASKCDHWAMHAACIARRWSKFQAFSRSYT